MLVWVLFEHIWAYDSILIFSKLHYVFSLGLCVCLTFYIFFVLCSVTLCCILSLLCFLNDKPSENMLRWNWRKNKCQKSAGIIVLFSTAKYHSPGHSYARNLTKWLFIFLCHHEVDMRLTTSQDPIGSSNRGGGASSRTKWMDERLDIMLTKERGFPFAIL